METIYVLCCKKARGGASVIQRRAWDPSAQPLGFPTCSDPISLPRSSLLTRSRNSISARRKSAAARCPAPSHSHQQTATAQVGAPPCPCVLSLCLCTPTSACPILTPTCPMPASLSPILTYVDPISTSVHPSVCVSHPDVHVDHGKGGAWEGIVAFISSSSLVFEWKNRLFCS